MRLYWPKDEALDGKWKAPPLTKVQCVCEFKSTL
jgi:hypothetical protein